MLIIKSNNNRLSIESTGDHEDLNCRVLVDFYLGLGQPTVEAVFHGLKTSWKVYKWYNVLETVP